MLHYRIAVSATLFSAATLATALMPERGSVHTAHRLHAAPRQETSPVNGVWVGRWKADGDPGEGKSLVCKTVQVAGDTWTATFEAVCDKDYAFTMEMPGRRVGKRVEFAVTVDLGQDYGGEYHWTGAVVGEQFSGSYTNAHYNGSFQMARSTEALANTGVYCEVPQTGKTASSQPPK